MEKLSERRYEEKDDGYVIIHKDFMSITFKIIYSLIAALIYVLFKLV